MALGQRSRSQRLNVNYLFYLQGLSTGGGDRGESGASVPNRVAQEAKPGLEPVTTPRLPMVERTVLAQTLELSTVIHKIAHQVSY